MVQINNDKWGFINTSGNFVIPAQFDDANSFSEGLAAVKVGDKWGYIDKTGQLKIKPQFDNALYFYNGLAVVVTVESVSGKISAPGTVMEGVSGKWGYMNRYGQYVWQSAN